ncbi:NfeD family protein [Mesomycoplasma dispar]|uniref:NfeD-like C-terminal domain-containing protein n=1 Tax=Mesomycoplasma dispar TaxID=86660 RepID=A0ABN5DTP3_9BACT|nr:NfeD family protein [Mesomycoplasma dispar]ATP59676.1 hypothetical protein CSW10_01855 [Mesomycoplasma dispar]
MNLDDISQVIILIIWILVISTFVLVELFTTGIWSGLASVAAIPSLLITIFTNNSYWIILIEFLIFPILVLILYLTIYRILKKKLGKLNKNTGNLQELLRQKLGFVHFETNEYGVGENRLGQVNVEGKIYRAFSIPGEGLIIKDTKIQVIEVKGNVLYIKKYK